VQHPIRRRRRQQPWNKKRGAESCGDNTLYKRAAIKLAWLAHAVSFTNGWAHKKVKKPEYRPRGFSSIIVLRKRLLPQKLRIATHSNDT
jgi:hypothetical protein